MTTKLLIVATAALGTITMVSLLNDIGNEFLMHEHLIDDAFDIIGNLQASQFRY